MFQRLLFFLQILIGMEAQEDDDMEVDAGQELVIIPVRDKGKDAKLVKAFSTSAGVTTIQINNSKHSGSVVCEVCSLSVTSMAALERHQKAKHSNRTFCCSECGVSKDSPRKLIDHQMTHKTTACPKCDKIISHHNKARHIKSCQGQDPKFQCDQCGVTTKTARGLNSHKIKFHQALSVENKTVFDCAYCNYQSKRKWDRDRHEEKCREKARLRQNPVEPLTSAEAIDWFGDLNISKEDFQSILEKICFIFADCS